MSVRTKAIAITGQGYPTHIVCQNKQIRIKHCRLVHISNVWVVIVLKLVNNIDLTLTDMEYNPAEVLIDSKDSNMSDNKIADPQIPVDIDSPPMIVVFACQDNDEINKQSASYVRSKSTRVMRQNKAMTPITKKLENVYVDLWGPYNLPSQSGSVYATILMCEHT